MVESRGGSWLSVNNPRGSNRPALYFTWTCERAILCFVHTVSSAGVCHHMQMMICLGAAIWRIRS